MAVSGVTEISVSHECMQNTAEIVDSRCVNCLQLRNELEEALNEVKSLQLIIELLRKNEFSDTDSSDKNHHIGKELSQYSKNDCTGLTTMKWTDIVKGKSFTQLRKEEKTAQKVPTITNGQVSRRVSKTTSVSQHAIRSKSGNSVSQSK
jgi:hypothetical protein